MSAPRPCETYLFHPPALFTPHILINFYIYSKLFPFFCLRYLHCVLVHLLFTYALLHNNLFRGSAPFSTYYFETLPLKLDADASQHGVGAVYARILSSLRKETVPNTLFAPCHLLFNCQVIVYLITSGVKWSNLV